jgi:hypothetical protein
MTRSGRRRRCRAVPLEPVDAVVVTMLIDNVSDMLPQDQGPAKRVGDAGVTPNGLVNNMR